MNTAFLNPERVIGIAEAKGGNALPVLIYAYIVTGTVLAWYGLIIFFFTRPKVKAQFK